MEETDEVVIFGASHGTHLEVRIDTIYFSVHV